VKYSALSGQIIDGRPGTDVIEVVSEEDNLFVRIHIFWIGDREVHVTRIPSSVVHSYRSWDELPEELCQVFRDYVNSRDRLVERSGELLPSRVG